MFNADCRDGDPPQPRRAGRAALSARCNRLAMIVNVLSEELAELRRELGTRETTQPPALTMPVRPMTDAERAGRG